MLSAAPKQIAENMVTSVSNAAAANRRKRFPVSGSISDVAISQPPAGSVSQAHRRDDGQPRAVFGKRIHQLPLNSLGR